MKKTGKVEAIKTIVYRTTDGKAFIGKDGKSSAEYHQRRISSKASIQKIADTIFYMQGPASWAIDDYNYVDPESEINQRWIRRAKEFAKEAGGVKKAVKLLALITRRRRCQCMRPLIR